MNISAAPIFANLWNFVGWLLMGLVAVALLANAPAWQPAQTNSTVKVAPTSSSTAAFNFKPHDETVHQPPGGHILFDLTPVGAGSPKISTIAGTLSIEGTTINLPTPLRVVKADGATITYSADQVLDFAADKYHSIGYYRIWGQNGELRLSGRNDQNNEILATSIKIGLISRWSAATVAILVLVFTCTSLWLIAKNNDIEGGFLLSLISNSGNYASLSQFQIMLWTFVIGAGSVYVMILTWHLIEIPPQTLGLLGIAGVGVVGSQLAAATPGTSAAKPTKNTSKMPRPSFYNLVIWDGEGQIDVTRVQILLFTAIAISFVIIQIINNNTIPDVPAGMITLMGISNGVYLTAKFIPPKAQAPL